MPFSPTNPVVRRCLQGLQAEAAGRADDARANFHGAWQDATDDQERFLAAWHVARLEGDPGARLAWLTQALQLAAALADPSVMAAFPPLHARMAECHEQVGALDAAERHRALAQDTTRPPEDPGPFYHGTRAALEPGALLVAGRASNYAAGLVMNHVYFTALADGAGLAAALASGEGEERVYEVAPTGAYEDDPNVTNQKFPGNPTRSYRSTAPLRVVRAVAAWPRPDPDMVRAWRARLAAQPGTIIN